MPFSHCYAAAVDKPLPPYIRYIADVLLRRRFADAARADSRAERRDARADARRGAAVTRRRGGLRHDAI